MNLKLKELTMGMEKERVAAHHRRRMRHFNGYELQLNLQSCACCMMCVLSTMHIRVPITPHHHQMGQRQVDFFAPGKSARIRLKTIQIDCHYWSNPTRHTNPTRFRRQLIPSNSCHTTINVCLYSSFSFRSKHFFFFFSNLNTQAGERTAKWFV